MSIRPNPSATGYAPPTAERPTAHSIDRRPFALGAALLTALCVAVYGNAIANPFHFDDISIILTDPRVQAFQTHELLTGNYWYTGNTDRLYRPLVLLSYAVNWAVSPEPWTFRVPNLVLHAGVCVVLWALIRRITGSNRAGLIGAGLFAVHPLHTEPLNTIVGRADLLVTLCLLGAAVLYWDDAPAGRTRIGRPVAAAALLALGLLSKENAVTLPGVVAVLDWWRVRRGDWPELRAWLPRRALRCYLPMLLLIGGYLALRVALFGQLASGSDVIDHFDNPIAHPTRNLEEGDSAYLARWATPLATFARAVRLHVVPVGLCFDYSYAAIETVGRWTDRRIWWGAGALLALGGLLAVSVRRRWGSEVPILLAAVTYSLVANVLVVIGTVFGERLLYLPSIGYCMIFGMLADRALRWSQAPPRRGQRPVGAVLAVGLGVVAVCYAYLTIQRNRDWQSEATLYTSAYQVNPRSCKVLAGMGAKAVEAGALRSALVYCRAAMDIAPDYWPAWRTAAVTMRRMADQSADPQERRALNDQALQCFKHTLQLGAGGDPAAMIGTAELLVERGDYDRAIALLDQLVRIRPREHRAFPTLARHLIEAEPVELRDEPRALECVRTAMRLQPEIANYVETLAEVLLALDRPAEAADAIRRVITELPPDSTGVRHLTDRLTEMEAAPKSTSRPRAAGATEPLG